MRRSRKSRFASPRDRRAFWRNLVLWLAFLASGTFTVKWSCDLSQGSCERINVEMHRLLGANEGL